jgi:hypothetical protein
LILIVPFLESLRPCGVRRNPTCLAVSFLHPAKEHLKCPVNPEKDVLENMGMNARKDRNSCFVKPQNLLLPDAGKTLSCALIVISSIGNAGIIENMAYFQHMLERLYLLARRIDAVFIGFGSQHIFL